MEAARPDRLSSSTVAKERSVQTSWVTEQLFQEPVSQKIHRHNTANYSVPGPSELTHLPSFSASSILPEPLADDESNMILHLHAGTPGL